MSAEEHYAALCAKVDAFFAGVHQRRRESMDCGTGCSDCCHVRLAVTAVEAAAVARYLASLAADERAKIAEAARRPSSARCAALDEHGRCNIYRARPLVCRSHGVAVRRREGGLPVIDCCERNFAGDGELESLGQDEILDQGTLSTVLAAVEAAFSDEYGIERGTRIDLAELLADPASFFEG